MYCSECGRPVPDAATVCMGCGVPVRPSKPVPAKPGAERFLIPIGRSGYAIAAGYLGLFSVLVIAAPFAFLFGVLALTDIEKNPHKLGRGRAWFGIVMGAMFSILGAAAFFTMK